MMHPHTVTDPLTETPTGPGRHRGALRGAGRVLARLFGLAVIAAAGVAGWFGIDQYVFPDIPGSFAAADTLWPADFARSATMWESYALSYSVDGVETDQIAFDATSKLTHLAYVDATGAVSNEVEIAGITAYERAAGSAEWAPVTADALDGHVRRGVLFTDPSHVSTIVPNAAHPFTTVTDSTDEVDGVHRLHVVIDAGALLDADPIAFYRWYATRDLTIDDVSDLRWTVDVRPDGYVVRWEGRATSIETWSEFPADLEFESPLASSELSASGPAETSAPTTVGG